MQRDLNARQGFANAALGLDEGKANMLFAQLAESNAGETAT